jgi:hypothetical protein
VAWGASREGELDDAERTAIRGSAFAPPQTR